MATGIIRISFMDLFLSTGGMVGMGTLLLCALAGLVVNRRSRVLRGACVAVTVAGVIYFSLVAALVVLFGASALPSLR